jgi:thiamine-phosphate pyrophosphorylase
VIVDHALAEARRMDVATLAQEIAAAGAGAIQFRAKHLSKAQYYQQAQPLLSLARSYRVPFFVNDHLDIALALSADGIHLGQNDLPFAAAKRLVPNQMILGVSTHSEAQAEQAAGVGVGYIAIGPVFSTATKADPEPVVGIATVRNVRKLIGSIPLIAIGGIDLRNVARVIAAGADGVAVASAVIMAENPAAALKSFKETIVRAKKR